MPNGLMFRILGSLVVEVRVRDRGLGGGAAVPVESYCKQRSERAVCFWSFVTSTVLYTVPFASSGVTSVFSPSGETHLTRGCRLCL